MRYLPALLVCAMPSISFAQCGDEIAVTLPNPRISDEGAWVYVKVENRSDFAFGAVEIKTVAASSGREFPWKDMSNRYTIEGGIEPGETYELGAWLDLPARALDQDPVVSTSIADVQDASGQWRCKKAEEQGAVTDEADSQQTASPAASATENIPTENKELEQAGIAFAIAHNCRQMINDEATDETIKVRFRDALAAAGTVDDPDAAIVELEQELASKPTDPAQEDNPFLVGICEEMQEAVTADQS